MIDALEAIDLPEEALEARTGPLKTLRVALRRGVNRARRTLDGPTGGLRRRHALRSNDLKKAELMGILESARQVTGRFGGVRIEELEKDLLCIF